MIIHSYFLYHHHQLHHGKYGDLICLSFSSSSSGYNNKAVMISSLFHAAWICHWLRRSKSQPCSSLSEPPILFFISCYASFFYFSPSPTSIYAFLPFLTRSYSLLGFSLSLFLYSFKNIHFTDNFGAATWPTLVIFNLLIRKIDIKVQQIF